jgi:hypothetical protein
VAQYFLKSCKKSVFPLKKSIFYIERRNFFENMDFIEILKPLCRGYFWLYNGISPSHRLAIVSWSYCQKGAEMAITETSLSIYWPIILTFSPLNLVKHMAMECALAQMDKANMPAHGTTASR